jgi:hypothetical protein
MEREAISQAALRLAVAPWRGARPASATRERRRHFKIPRALHRAVEDLPMTVAGKDQRPPDAGAGHG